jgi:hypothetical protein
MHVNVKMMHPTVVRLRKCMVSYCKRRVRGSGRLVGMLRNTPHLLRNPSLLADALGHVTRGFFADSFSLHTCGLATKMIRSARVRAPGRGGATRLLVGCPPWVLSLEPPDGAAIFPEPQEFRIRFSP